MKSTQVTKNNTAFLYLRLSRDDNLEGESNSIQNQKKILTKSAKEKGYVNLVCFIDDGISGVTMNRPSFQNMIKEIEKGKASAVFVKDLSRLGRNYIEVGNLTENFFPEHNIRLVALSDGVDTNEGDNELTPIRNLFNEWYARDISKKRRLSNKVKGGSGEPLGLPPYGYIKDPNNPKFWIVDEEAANIVRKIFQLSLEGNGCTQIANYLVENKILSPKYYWISKGIKKPIRHDTTEVVYYWGHTTVSRILATQEYCGDVINFKTYSLSYKNKKRLTNSDDNIRIFTDVHEAIINRLDFEKVQEMKSKGRKKINNFDGEKNIFSGLLVCSECGKNLHYHFNQSNHDIKYFSCSNYKGNKKTGTCETTHYIRIDFLEKIVLAEIRRLTKFATKYEDIFTQAVIGRCNSVLKKDIQLKEKEQRILSSRVKEIDVLFEKIYEDNIFGRLSDERFKILSDKYENEQASVKEKLSLINDELEKLNNKSLTSDIFLDSVQKYTRAKKLSTRMLNELIEKIVVYPIEKVDGYQKQNIEIHYNCVGYMRIPENIPLDFPKIEMNVRKGVNLRYVQTQNNT